MISVHASVLIVAREHSLYLLEIHIRQTSVNDKKFFRINIKIFRRNCKVP